jgi:hypothetical protein
MISHFRVRATCSPYFVGLGALSSLWLCSTICDAGQHASCPSGMAYAGTLEGSTTGREVKIRPSLSLPGGISLDSSYQQPSPSGHGGQAQSILSSQQIPPGIYIMPSGIGTYGWAVSDPVLNGNTFTMYLYCSMDESGLNPVLHPGCSVWVDVCAKGSSQAVSPAVGVSPPVVPNLPQQSHLYSSRRGLDKIWISIANHSTFGHTYTIRNGTCTPQCCDSQWTTIVGPGKSVPIGLCSNYTFDDGYGEFYYHSESESQWTHQALLRSGQVVSLY